MDVCTCGHAEDQHGGDPKYPGSTACHGDIDCGCVCYEADDEEDDEDEDDEE